MVPAGLRHHRREDRPDRLPHRIGGRERCPLVSGNGDPGDCFIIATARVSKFAVVTRDGNMQRLSAKDPNYLKTIAC